MDYANYNSVPEKIRRAMKCTGSLAGRDGLDIVIRFDAEKCDVDGFTVKLTNCILRMTLVVSWPDAMEQTVTRCVHHKEFTAVRYHCTLRQIAHETEESQERRQVAEAQEGPEN